LTPITDITLEVAEESLDGFEDRSLRLVEADGVVLAAAVAERQAEDNDPGQLAADLKRVRRPIELTLTTGWRLVADRRFARYSRRADVPQIGVERGRSTGVANGAQLAEDA
jgi:hypothetical protein